MNLFVSIFFQKKKNDSKNWSFFLNYDSQIFFWSTNATHRTEFFFNTTHRIVFFFLNVTFFVTLNLFFEFDSKNWSSPIRLRGITFFSDMSQRIAPLFHMNYFYMTQRTWLFFQYESNIFLNESKSWTPFWIWLKELTPFSLIWRKELNLFFFNITQRIEPFFLSMIQRIESLSEYDSKKKKSNSFFEYDSMNRTLFFLNVSQIEIFGWKIVKKNKIDFFTWPEESNPLFFNMTQRIEPFSIGLKDSMLFSLTQRIELCLNRTYTIGPFFLNMTQRIEIFSWFFYMSTFFKNDADNWTLFSLNMTQRIEPFLLLMWRQEFEFDFFLEYDAKNWTLFLFVAKKRTFISRYEWLQELYVSNKKNTQWIELLKYDSKNWTFEPCVKKKDSENGSKNWTLCFSQNVSKNWTFFKKKKMLKELNLSFIWTTLLHDSMNWTFLNLTRRVESFPIWLKELDFFLNMTRRIEPFLPWLERIEPLSFFEYDSKTWTFVWVWLKEVSLFFFLNMTQRSELFSKSDSKNWTFF